MFVDLSQAWQNAKRILDAVIYLLPNLVLAIGTFCIFLAIASLTRSLVRRVASRRAHHQSLGLLLGHLARAIVIIVGSLIALSVVAPSFRAVDLVKLLGIGSVAVGFAFQNILQNFLAGILLLLQEPFRIGDFISVTGIEGTVYDIQSRATVITTKEGRQVIIPNAIIFTSPVAVEHPAGQEVREGAGAASRGSWSDLFKTGFRRPSSPGAK